MNYTKEEIKELFLKIMSDLEKDYFNEEDIYIFYEENTKHLWIKDPIPKTWTASVEATDNLNYPGRHSIGLTINDETGEVVNYVEGPGRPVPTTLKKNAEGKYEIAALEY